MFSRPPFFGRDLGQQLTFDGKARGMDWDNVHRPVLLPNDTSDHERQAASLENRLHGVTEASFYPAMRVKK